MPEKDIYEDLCKYYEFMLGKIPGKDRFKAALRLTVTPQELAVFFLIPFSGVIQHKKLEQKAARAGISTAQLETTLKRLQPEGFLLNYDTPTGRVYERGNPAFMTEQQVRKQDETPVRSTYAEFMNAIIEGAASAVPNKTPYYRVVPVESMLTGEDPEKRIHLDAVVKDPRAVLPIDKVSAILKEVKLIGVAECYCRKTKKVVGEPCEHPLETCFVFDGLAQTLIESGIARQLNYDEAMSILDDCERQGLVHNVDNCQGSYKSLCNCCACSCVVFKTMQRGQTNAGSASRYVIEFDAEKCKSSGKCFAVCPSGALKKGNGIPKLNDTFCLGCGQCASVCPEGALRLVTRPAKLNIPKTNAAMMSKITREAVVGLAINKILSR